MSKPLTLAAALLAAAVPAAAPAQVWAPAPAAWQAGDGDGYYHEAGYRGRRYAAPRRYGRARCYDRGNGGLAIGGIVGALAGRSIAGHGDKTLGTILGAGAGALAGRAIDRSDGARCYR